MEFEALARDALPPAHFGYIATDDDRTVERNHDAFSHYEIRAHRVNDLTHLDTALTLFGASWRSPIYLSAASAMRVFHPDAELDVARAARSRATQMMLSTGAVGISRPQAWGLAAFGQPGVEAVIDILNRELNSIMRQAGTPSLASIKHDLLVRTPS